MRVPVALLASLMLLTGKDVNSSRGHTIILSSCSPRLQ